MKILRATFLGVPGLADAAFDFANPATGAPHDVVILGGPAASGKTRALEAIVAAKEVGLLGCEMIADLNGDFHAGVATHPGSGGAGNGGGSDAGDAGEPDADAGTDADAGGAGGAGGADGGCVSATYPDPPGGADPPGGDTFVVAIHSIDLGDMGTQPGYDLDHHCTCPVEGPTCVSSTKHCDGPGGIDDGAAALIQGIKVAVPALSSANLSARADQGYWSFLVRVSGYNGMPDDPAVQVAFYATGKPETNDAGMHSTPAWDGNDAWEVSSDGVNAGDVNQPIYVSQGAYVAQGILVAAAAAVDIKFSGDAASQLAVHATNNVATAQIVKTGGTYSLKGGIIAGRVLANDLFKMMSGLRDANGDPICTD